MKSAILFLMSAVALGHALQIFNGFYHPWALDWMTAGLVLCLGGVATMTPPRSMPANGTSLVQAILALALGWQLMDLFGTAPGWYIEPTSSVAVFRVLLALQAASIGAGLWQVPRLRRLWFPAVLVLGAAMGVWMIRASPHPYIDVVVVHRAAIDALLSHRDPYRISFRNIYGDSSGNYYSPGTVIGDQVSIGFPYPPMSLLLATPGQLLGGDYRYAAVAALIAGGALIGSTGRGLLPKLAACVLLTTPRVYFVIEQGWTEPFAIVLLALTVFGLGRMPVVAGIAGALLIVTKQYLLLMALPLLYVSFPLNRQRVLGLGGGAFLAAAATLPLALWHPNAFIRNVFLVQANDLFRTDSLSYLSWFARNGLSGASLAWSLPAAAVALALSLFRAPKTAAGFASAIAFGSYLMFAFGSKAFCNYYLFVIAALCASAAASCRTAEALRELDIGTPERRS